jgi:vacuolar-type H+-ATPase subunit H
VTDAPASPASDTATVEALRRLKAVEREWEEKLLAARAAADEAVRRARDESEATVKAVVAEAEAERARRLEAGRAAADREAEGIVRDGAKAADELRARKGARPADRSEEIVAAALGPYAHD